MVGPVRFDGDTYDPAADKARLSGQLDTVRATMADGEWHTLQELASRAGASTAAVSARVRDLRKPRFGGYKIEREHVTDGIHRYRMLSPGGMAGTLGTLAEAKAPFGPEDVAAALDALRRIWPMVPAQDRSALGKLGKWLAAK